MKLSEKAMAFLTEHINYPATGKEIASADFSVSNVPENEVGYIQNHLIPDYAYGSPEEIVIDLQQSEEKQSDT